MKIYNKLIRDNIPSIIESCGKKPFYKTLDEKEYMDELDKKLQEELNEYYESKEIEELADLEEVIHAIVIAKNIKMNEFGKMRERKAKEKGIFRNRFYLERVDD